MRAFLDAHAALILRLARGAVRESGGPEESVEPAEVAHEVMVSLLRLHRAGGFDPERTENVEAYLRTVVRNAAHRVRKRASGAGREVIRLSDGESDLSSSRSPEDARRVLEAVKARLPARDALALALFVEEGLDADEIAARLRVTLSDVYETRRRILEDARRVLGKGAA